MKTKFTFFLIIISAYIFGQSAPAYYNGLDFSKTGNAMKDQLATLITNTHTYEITYGTETNNVLKISDADPDVPGNILLLYGSSTANDKYQRSRISSGTWNKEHTYPRSLGTPNLQYSGPGADAHHLRPTDNTMNSDRGSLLFADGSGATAVKTGGGWFPGNEWRGDVARMMMYMYVRYNTRAQATNVGLGPTTYSADMPDIFIKWNIEDPVSNFEVQRNNYVYSVQGNRNPFIDNPYLATVIWGGPTAENKWPGNFSSDTEAPTTPTNLAVTGKSESTVSLSWTASTDNVAVTGYEIYVDGVLKTTVTGTTATITGLLASTTYNFYVKAKDAANNISAQSNTVQATTDVSSDTQAPSIPTNLTVGTVTSSSIALSWTESTDNVAVIGYDVYVDGVLYTTVTSASANITGLSASTTYNFYVVAKDAANNRTQSQTVQGITSAASTTCGTETFTNIPAASSSYTSNSWTSNSVNWTATDSRTDESINGRAIVVRNGTLSSSKISGGIGSLTVTTKQFYSSGSAGNVTLKINGIDKGTIPYNAAGGAAITTTVSNINVSGDVVITLDKAGTTTRVGFDDLSWTCYATMGTNEAKTNKNSLRISPNPVKNAEINIYGLEAKGKVEIYSMNGQIVQTTENVSKTSNKVLLKNLPKGVYILKAENKSVKFIVD